MIITDLLKGSNHPFKGEIIFQSTDHIRFQNGVNVSGHNYGCNRAVKIESNISNNKGYTVTIYNLDSPHPIWKNNIQMSPKQMEITEVQDNVVTLRGYGSDAMGGNFADYGLIVICKGNEIECIKLQMLDRGVMLEYYK